MDKRQAKRNACWSASEVLRNALDSGWETDGKYPHPEDEEKFLAALYDLIAELERRGAGKE